MGSAISQGIGQNLAANITGRTDGLSPSAGKIGEVLQGNRVRGSGVNLVNATPTSIASITLTAGCWAVQSTPVIEGSGATASVAIFSTNTSVADGGVSTVGNPSGGVTRNDVLMGGASLGGNIVCNQINSGVINTTGTTLYLVCDLFISAGTAVGYGSIRATRIG